jgi:hypothetical protein
MRKLQAAMLVTALIPALIAQPAQHAKSARRPFQAQSSSTIAFGVKDGSEAIDIANVAYDVTGQGVPGRPLDERLVLRTTTRTKQVIDEIGMEASSTVEAWPLGVDLKSKPLYSVTVPGMDFRTMDGAIFVVLRGLEDTEWWSVHKLGTGEHLFDSYVPLVRFSIARDTLTLRYAGLDVPPDDTKDTRLKDEHVVGVLTYASADRVIREALITSDDPQQARLLRSYADCTRTVSYSERPSRSLRIAISQN